MNSNSIDAARGYLSDSSAYMSSISSVPPQYIDHSSSYGDLTTKKLLLSILEVVSFFIVVTFTFHFIVCLVTRYWHRIINFRRRTPEQTTMRVVETRLDEQILRKIPVKVFSFDADILPTIDTCAICLGDFENGDIIRILPECNHGFHRHCVDTWLSFNSSCPNYRHSLVDAESAISISVS
ncbi:hypothetical protein ZOSMA_170G00180 [Zostera marina]|uniref:RING-type domain-containing protein n=1 Tax=Zostera marina TaxID=29655 RepID=A0A0K9PUR4_ZOSMR|nr:hypothetical protein ZOSMA_170G00180 [Zostera marina]